MQAVILAGGLGTRLRSTVPDLPKPMAPVSGRPFLAWLLDYWIGQGVSRFILSVGYRSDAIRSYFSASYREVPIAYTTEDEPLGTGGALLRAAEMIDGPGTFLALNGDTYFEVTLDALATCHARNHAQWTLALFQDEGGARFDSVSVASDGRIVAFGHGSGSLRNGGAYAIDPECLNALRQAKRGPCSLERDLLPSLLQNGAALYGTISHGKFLDIGVPADYARANDLLSSNSRS